MTHIDKDASQTVILNLTKNIAKMIKTGSIRPGETIIEVMQSFLFCHEDNFRPFFVFVRFQQALALVYLTNVFVVTLQF